MNNKIDIQISGNADSLVKELKKLNTHFAQLDTKLKALDSKKLSRLTKYKKILIDIENIKSKSVSIDDKTLKIQNKLNKLNDERLKQDAEKLKLINNQNAALSRQETLFKNLSRVNTHSQEDIDFRNRQEDRLDRAERRRERVVDNSDRQRRRNLNPVRSVSELGITGLGLNHLFGSLFSQEYNVSRFTSDAAAFNQPTVKEFQNLNVADPNQITALKNLQEDFKDFLFDETGSSTINMTQAAESLQQIVKDGVRIKNSTIAISNLPPSLTSKFEQVLLNPDSDPTDVNFAKLFNKLTEDGQVDTIDFQKLLTSQALTTARFLGNPDLAPVIADTIGEGLDKIITVDNIESNINYAKDFARAFSFAVTSSRFTEDQTAKFLRNVASLQTLLPNFDINDKLIVATIADRTNISGRSVGTGIRRLGEELRPLNKEDQRTFNSLGIAPDFFAGSKNVNQLQRKISVVNTKLSKKIGAELNLNDQEIIEAMKNPQSINGGKIYTKLEAFWIRLLGTSAVRGLRPFLDPNIKQAIEEQQKLLSDLELGKTIEFRETKTFSGSFLQLSVQLKKLKMVVIESSGALIGFVNLFNSFSKKISSLNKTIAENPELGKLIGSITTFLVVAVTVTVIFGLLSIIFTKIISNKFLILGVLSTLSYILPQLIDMSSGISLVVNILLKLSAVIFTFVLISKIIKLFKNLKNAIIAYEIINKITTVLVALRTGWLKLRVVMIGLIATSRGLSLALISQKLAAFKLFIIMKSSLIITKLTSAFVFLKGIIMTSILAVKGLTISSILLNLTLLRLKTSILLTVAINKLSTALIFLRNTFLLTSAFAIKAVTSFTLLTLSLIKFKIVTLGALILSKLIIALQFFKKVLISIRASMMLLTTASILFQLSLVRLKVAIVATLIITSLTKAFILLRNAILSLSILSGLTSLFSAIGIGFATIIGAISAPVLAIVVGITALISGLIYLESKFGIVSNTFSWVADKFSSAMEIILESLKMFFSPIDTLRKIFSIDDEKIQPAINNSIVPSYLDYLPFFELFKYIDASREKPFDFQPEKIQQEANEKRIEIEQENNDAILERLDTLISTMSDFFSFQDRPLTASDVIGSNNTLQGP